MTSLRRNPETRIFDKINTLQFELPLNSENLESEIPDNKHSSNRSMTKNDDYNKFFLDILEDINLQQIAKSQDEKIFIEYISNKFQTTFPNYQRDFHEIAIQRVCTRDWCTSAYTLFVVMAIAAINISVIAVDTTFPFRNHEEENLFFNGTITLATVLGNKDFGENVKNYISNELYQIGVEI